MNAEVVAQLPYLQETEPSLLGVRVAIERPDVKGRANAKLPLQAGHLHGAMRNVINVMAKLDVARLKQSAQALKAEVLRYFHRR